MIFSQNPRVKFALFFDAILDNLAQKLEGTKAFKLNIFQEIFGFLRVILTPESTQKTLFESIILPIVLQNQK